jgi:FtsP/CotA-like multicopper oxidase with cupredoxin domain
MKRTTSLFYIDEICLPRRQFVKGVAMGGALLGLGLSPACLLASTGTSSGQQTLRGNQFDLALAHQKVNYTGKERLATAVNGSVPGPVMRWRVGDRVTLIVAFRMAV